MILLSMNFGGTKHPFYFFLHLIKCCSCVGGGGGDDRVIRIHKSICCFWCTKLDLQARFITKTTDLEIGLASLLDNLAIHTTQQIHIWPKEKRMKTTLICKYVFKGNLLRGLNDEWSVCAVLHHGIQWVSSIVRIKTVNFNVLVVYKHAYRVPESLNALLCECKFNALTVVIMCSMF